MSLLKSSKVFKRPEGPIVQIIMDGVGIAPAGEGNAVKLANTPTLDHLLATCPHTQIAAHGKAVGLPSDADMGNSEVGHNALGAGRVFDQGAKLVNGAIESGAIFNGTVFKEMVANCLKNNSTFHLIGLLSDGNVHSHIDQLCAIIGGIAKAGVQKVRVHILTDGRDVAERSALTYVEKLEAHLAKFNAEGKDFAIASGGGRMNITMDRYEADWSMVKRGWETHVLAKGRTFKCASCAIKTYYDEDPNVNDQFLPAFVIVDENGKPKGPIVAGDAVAFFNFRGDRAIEISRAFDDEEFDKFERGPRPDVYYAGLMEYDGDLHIPKHFLVSPPAINNTMSYYLAESGIRQFACAETQKFGHVTYFWNGNRSGKFSDELETYVEVPSDTIPFEQRPWMKSAEVTDELLKAIDSGKYDYLRVNYANGDMVGHTGHLAAAIIAVSAVDLALSRLLPAIKAAKGVLIVTADHGNADEMFTLKKGQIVRDANGVPAPKTSHTLNPVPYIVFDPAGRYAINSAATNPGLANNAATIMNLLGYEAPEDYLPSLITLK